MSERKSKEYESVDLTEDEASSEGNSELDSPFDFVDCSSSSRVPSFLLENAVTASPSDSKHTTSPNNLPRLVIRPDSKNAEITSDKKVRQFTSIQLKPPINSMTNSQSRPGKNISSEIETVNLDSDNEVDAVNHQPKTSLLPGGAKLSRQTEVPKIPQLETMYSPKQPPGKVVTIKKNNQYYKIIIPYNLMPNINMATGPVLINIPEVGSLVMNLDHTATKGKPANLKNQQLSLNLDTIQPKPDRRKVLSIKEQMLRDKKFCWTFNTMRKRDLEGFTAGDRMGFNKTEITKANRCERTMNSIISKYEENLTATVVEFHKFKEEVRKKSKVKLVKINHIINSRKKPNSRSRGSKVLQSDKSTPPLLQARKRKITSTVKNHEVVTSYDDDLLVTKKVVILDSKNEEIHHKKVIGLKSKLVNEEKRRTRPRKIRKFDIKPCCVEIVKDKGVEDAYKKLCKGLSTTVKRKPGPKSKTKMNTSLSKQKLSNGQSAVSPNRFVANHLGFKQTKLFENRNMLLCRIIQTEQELEKDLNTLKPILIVTEETITLRTDLEYYRSEFNKNNIFYVVNSNRRIPNSILKVEGFTSAVKSGFIKLVDANLFCKFVKGGMNRGEGSNSEHNYSFFKT